LKWKKWKVAPKTLVNPERFGIFVLKIFVILPVIELVTGLVVEPVETTMMGMSLRQAQ
jgi:hypothetical protein